MVAPVIIWGGAAALLAIGIGAGTGTHTGAREIGEGAGDGLRYGLPILATATAIYLFMEARK